jgi:uncharacterized iron-regulated membrane protein
LRYALTLLHRWVGLSIAAFLFIAGITGAIISWDHELDELLNGHLIEAKAIGSQLAPLALKDIVEARDPRRQVTYLPLVTEAGHSLSMFVEPCVDPATGAQPSLGYNQVFVDGATGEELGKREWGAVWPITTENFVSFLYRLHYTLHIPAFWGIEQWGTWLMGGVALIWMFDCFVGFYLTLPVRRARNASRAVEVQRRLESGFWQRWKPAWGIKFSGSPFRINFDLHRAFGLWTWALLFLLAFTGFSLNLYREIFLPLLSMVSTVTPSPFDARVPVAPDRPITAKMSYGDILARAEVEGRRRGWAEPAGAIGYARRFGIYRVWYFFPGGDHGSAGVGPAEIYFDAQDGRVLGARQPWTGTAADIFVQAQLPLHSGRILGLPGRILVSVMGIVVAGLSVTGFVIWTRKRRARMTRNARARGERRTWQPRWRTDAPIE